MQFKGWHGQNKYTMTIEENKVAQISVENREIGTTTLYKRNPTQQENSLDKDIVERTLRAICQGNSQLWRIIYNLLYLDNCYGQDLIEKIFKVRRVS